MAYSELIKSFERIRGYLRQFYIYGFRVREEYTGGHPKAMSARSYDDQRRRIESYLTDSICSRQTPRGKQLYLPIDSRRDGHNPLYRTWKTKTFTDGDVTLHFHLLGLLSESAMTLRELLDALGDRLAAFPDAKVFDESTVRKKLGEYGKLGIVIAEKTGNQIRYRLSADEVDESLRNLLDFFSEVAPCGLLGSTCLDRLPGAESFFLFKHHCLSFALESQVLYALFDAISSHKWVTFRTFGGKGRSERQKTVLPLAIRIGVQSGREYLMAYTPAFGISSYRLDCLCDVTPGEVCPDFDLYRQHYRRIEPHIFGAVCKGDGGRVEHVEFILRIGEGEEHILRRLNREKRCGTVESLGNGLWKYSADVYDTNELTTWVRTFLGRIVQLEFSNRTVENRIKSDFLEMRRMYGIGGDDDALS